MRVVMLEVPRLLRDLLEHAIHQDGGCELLKASEVTATPSDQMSPDMIILGLTADEDATLVPALFARWPRAQILTVMQCGDAAALYEMRRHRRQLGEVSPSELLQTLRDAVQHNRRQSSGTGEDDDVRAV
jgi:hypothetical protein